MNTSSAPRPPDAETGFKLLEEKPDSLKDFRAARLLRG
jgi:hypothetical protein